MPFGFSLARTLGFIIKACSILVHTDDDEYGEMHLQPDPLFSIPSDNIHLPSITGTLGGRIFMGGKDACVYEVVYQV